MTSRQPEQRPDQRMIRSSAAEYLTFVAADGKHYNTNHYSPAAISAADSGAT